MFHKIVKIEPLKKLCLMAEFLDGTVKKYDMNHMLCVYPPFEELVKIEGLFEQVQIDMGGHAISWNEDLDLSSEEIWTNGEQIRENPIDFKRALATELSKAQEAVGMTQTELAEKVGIDGSEIYQVRRKAPIFRYGDIRRLICND